MQAPPQLEASAISPVTVPRLDAHAPPRVAELVEAAGVRKADMPLVQMLALGFLAGLFIALGAMLYIVVVSGVGPAIGPGLSRWIGGVAFSLGLMLVVVGGAELFTANNLLVMAWAERKVNSPALIRNWAVYLRRPPSGASA